MRQRFSTNRPFCGNDLQLMKILYLLKFQILLGFQNFLHETAELVCIKRRSLTQFYKHFQLCMRNFAICCLANKVKQLWMDKCRDAWQRRWINKLLPCDTPTCVNVNKIKNSDK